LGGRLSSKLKQAKFALDLVIKKSRVHFYKPIQIAEILHMNRTTCDVANLLDLESYRNPSKKWRDRVCIQFLGRVSTSSARFQDNLFEDNAIPPKHLKVLAQENVRHHGVVEAYIYQAFEDKHLQLENALNYCLNSTRKSFDVQCFFDMFWVQPGLKRSLDKVFEMVVYSLFEVLITALKVKIDIYYDTAQSKLIDTFSDFVTKVLNLDAACPRKTLDAHFHRVGVTNAADRGLDIYANFGSVVQVKHLSLDEDLAEGVVNSITSDRIIIVCKHSEEKIINSLLTQIGWRSRIQAVITIDEIVSWYGEALTGSFSDRIGDQLIASLASEIKTEFPSVGYDGFQQFKQQRGYNERCHPYWVPNF